ncbi:MAG: GNAT family N-acetyltransferase [Acidimicrobiia bacterium]|nr:GNAT family N-acetyltransferase [Acidimicrobiia bacterium]
MLATVGLWAVPAGAGIPQLEIEETVSCNTETGEHVIDWSITNTLDNEIDFTSAEGLTVPGGTATSTDGPTPDVLPSGDTATGTTTLTGEFTGQVELIAQFMLVTGDPGAADGLADLPEPCEQVVEPTTTTTTAPPPETLAPAPEPIQEAPTFTGLEPGVPGLTPPDPPLDDGVVRLRPWARDDIDQLVEACQDAVKIQRFIPIPRPYDRDDAEGYVQRTERQWREGTTAAFAIVHADDPTRVLGAINSCWRARWGTPATGWRRGRAGGGWRPARHGC